MQSIDKLASKAGIDLLDGKNYPPPKQRGARFWAKLIGMGKKGEAMEALREIEVANQLAEAHKQNAKLADEKAELIGRIADLEHRLAGYLVAERLAAHGVPAADCKFLATGEAA
jgi:hypothetical protein